MARKRRPRITKRLFREYERVRRSGKTNMMYTVSVCELSDFALTRDQVVEIIVRYDEYNRRWPDVRKDKKFEI